MMLINNDEQLRQFLPNVLATCEGEVSLFDKLQFHLNNAEQWLAENVTGRDFISTVAGAQADDATRALLCQTIAAHAFHVALPSLDLVLTPTGFGIVSNGNIAPASAERVARLSESLLLLRDTLIDQLLSHLCQNASWRETPQQPISRLRCSPHWSCHGLPVIRAIFGNITACSGSRFSLSSTNLLPSTSPKHFTHAFGSTLYSRRCLPPSCLSSSTFETSRLNFWQGSRLIMSFSKAL